ncbi:uncharacterized protein LOC122301869 [Carya illinoinensis]|uniref:uncharacterized protein LOC122301869 n=1 Tax=Carya illinoinensis TaxID=32201 RepID=UPI001C718109|nr:uncharacterized protein LOC122301869 [Carya illinoinensis]
MSILVWNCRGLGNPQTVRVLRQLAKDKILSLVFLVETKCNCRRMDMIRRKLRFDNCLAVDSVGLRGGIALLWKTDWNVEIISYSRWHVNSIVLEEENGPAWQFTGLYGHPEVAKRSSSWQLLHMLKPTTPMAWLCAGDFNEILYQKEKLGGASRPYKQIEEFRQVVERCGLSDLQSRGQKYTWANNKFGGDFIKERIDRAFANKEWSNLHSLASCTILPAVNSDHSPLYINKQFLNCIRNKRGLIFRYEAAWDLRDEC